MVRIWLLLFCASVVHSQQEGESCGSDSIPYKIVVDQSGKPELFCESPVCIGEGSNYYERKNRRHQRHTGKELAQCNHQLLETVCVGETEWTGTLIEVNNGTHRTLKTECCAFEGMSSSNELKTVLLEAGDTFQGGVVEVHGKAKAFDLIKEVRKTVNSENSVQYIISVFRMPCSAGSEFVPYSALLNNKSKKRVERREASSLDSDDEVSRTNGVEEYDYPRGRKYPAPRRRPMFRRNEEYEYTYDYDYPIRAAMRRNRMRNPASAGEDRLWPITYGQKNPGLRRRAYAPSPSVSGDGVGANSEYIQTTEEATVVAPQPVEPAQVVQPEQPQQSVGYSAPVQQQGIAVQQHGLPLYDSAPQQAPAVSPMNPFPMASYAMGAPQSPAFGVPQQPYAVAPMNMYASAPLPQGNSYLQYAPTFAPPQASYQQPSYGGGCGVSPCAGGGLNGAFDAMQCFSGDMEVETPSGRKPIQDIKIGDMVLSIEDSLISFSPVVMLLHKDDGEDAEFNEIKTETGHMLKLTDYHLVYVTDCDPQDTLRLEKAADVQVGHCVHVITDVLKTNLNAKRVVEIKKVKGRGIYAPLTVTGDIIVNDVLASCHSNLAIKSLQQSFFNIYRAVQRSFSSLIPSSDPNELPLGVGYLTTVIDLFLPKTLLH